MYNLTIQTIYFEIGKHGIKIVDFIQTVMPSGENEQSKFGIPHDQLKFGINQSNLDANV